MDGVKTGWAAVVAGALWLAFTAVAPAEPASGPPAESAPEPAKTAPTKEIRETPSMVFFIAKGEADACGPGCGEWIAADGKFDATTPGRMRAVLAKLGKRQLPIFFFSPGGSVDAAVEVGHMMRRGGMRAGVARTIPQGCDPKQRRERACDAIMRSGRELAADLQTRASCASACVYALLGATVREIAPNAALGIHSISITRRLTLKNRDGRILAVKSMKLPGNSESTHKAHEKVVRYAREMGFGRALIDAAAAVPHEKIRALTRDEIADFGIDTRAVSETRWLREEDSKGRVGVFKYIVSARGSAPKRYRLSVIRLSCASPKQPIVMLAREHSAIEKVRSVGISAGGREIPLRSFGDLKKTENGMETEARGGLAAPSYFEDAVKGEHIEIVEVPQTEDPKAAPQRTQLSTAGLAASLSALPEKCFQPGQSP